MALKRLSDLTEEGKAEALALVEERYGKPSDKFDYYGLRYNIDQLNKIGGSIINIPLECMAEYVDVVTKTAIDKNDGLFILTQILNVDYDKLNCSKLNTTAIGNISYVCLHCKDESARIKSEKFLEKYADWFNKNNRKNIN
jgi:hypothetical protein